MGLKKEKKNEVENADEKRTTDRSFDGLLTLLNAEDISERRWAARDLAAYAEAVEPLLCALSKESEHIVRNAMFDALQSIGGDTVVCGLIELLRVEDAEIRNTAIEMLQSMPDGLERHIIELLNDQNSDVRIFAVDILQMLAHPKTPEWLLSVLKEENHINVICTTVDRLAEVGTPQMIPELEGVKNRFPNQEYLNFAVDTAIRRIQGG